jgi:hypothetical protein
MYLMVRPFPFRIFVDWGPQLTSGVENVALLNVGLEQLCSHPYWTRVWTVQEVALSKNCWIYLGQLNPMKWLEFTAMLWEVEGYINKRSEETTQPDLEYLYPVSYKRWSQVPPHIFIALFDPRASPRILGILGRLLGI